MREGRLRWFGHVQRREEEEPAKTTPSFEVERPRPRGRQGRDGKRWWKVTRGGKDCGGETPWTEKGGEEGLERPTLKRHWTMAEEEEEEKRRSLRLVPKGLIAWQTLSALDTCVTRSCKCPFIRSLGTQSLLQLS